MLSSAKPGALMSQEGAIFTALFVSSALRHLWLGCVRAARDRLYTLIGHVSELTVYPIKGCGGVEMQSATSTITGLYGDYCDRWWMILSDKGNFLSMRTNPILTFITYAIDGDFLVVSAPEMTPLRLPKCPDPARYQKFTARMYSMDITALDCGPEAHSWMSRYLGQPVRLIHSRPDIGSRDSYDFVMDWENQARKGDKVIFAYLSAILLTTTASLSDLNSRLDNPVTMRHFRPNIMVESSLPYDEDNWEEMRIGTKATFHYVQPCLRCVITTIDPMSAKNNEKQQPLKMLKSYRCRDPYGIRPVFGAYFAVNQCGPVSVGDPVYVIRRQPATS